MSSVQLYVYDLSNGMARQLSLMLTGRQIDGVWHTSVVVFGKEVFYGQGILITEPGQSHHGQPLRMIDMGETELDEGTFEEYIASMRESYTAEKYHLLDFNCNSFTNDCLGFLTGNGLPAYIKSLPNDFLSTPFGQALRPTIDAMFEGRPVTYNVPNRPPPAPASTNTPAVATGLLQSVAAQATAAGPSVGGASSTPPAPAPAPLVAPASIQPQQAPSAPLTAPMHITTNPASFESLLHSHRAVVAFFTSATCGPCRVIEPVFEELARTKSRASGGVGFAKIDLGVGLGGAVASQYQVRATPTFIFFLDGNKTHEVKGANAPELKVQVDLLIYEAFPPHAHMKLQLPAIESISLSPILFNQIPKLDTLFAKLVEFIDCVPSWKGTVTQAQAKRTLSETVLPFLKASQQPKSASFDSWTQLTYSLADNLALTALFPVADIWRLALLSAPFAAWNATSTKVSEGAIKRLMDKALETEDVPRNYLLTVLRMLANTLSNDVLAREVILFVREGVTKLLVDALLHDDPIVRTAAASLAFNIAAYLQKQRVGKVKARDDSTGVEENEEWQVELVVAVLGGIERESSSEETVHRLAACLALLLRLSPYTEELTALLDTLQAQEVLKRKLELDGTSGVRGAAGEGGVATKKEVRRLILEVADKLCPKST